MSLEVRNLSFGYPRHPVGKDVSFIVEPGEVLCLLGPNGCGKTTLFKTILGLIKRYAGAVSLDGSDLSTWPRQRIARRLAYVPQQHDAYFPFTVAEVVLMGRSAHVGLFASPSQHDEVLVDQSLASLRIGHLRDDVYTQISGGERQLTLVARALTQEPSYLIMDEPTANLDFGNQLLVLEHIRELKRSGLGIVLSTHDPDQAFQCADRVAMLRHGQLFRLGPTAEVITGANLRTLYDVSVDVLELPSSALARRVCVPVSDTRHNQPPEA